MNVVALICTIVFALVSHFYNIEMSIKKREINPPHTQKVSVQI